MGKPVPTFPVIFSHNSPSKEEKPPETISIEVLLPSALKNRAFENEHTVNLLNIAVISYNNELIEKPETGTLKAVILLKNEKTEYEVRVHGISFNPTMDLENTQLFAEISSNDNKMLQRLINDGVLSFYVSGKLTQNKEKELENVVITKIIAHVDQTAYAKKFEKVKRSNNSNIPPYIVKKEIFDNPNIDGVGMNKLSKLWEDIKKDDLPKNTPTLFDKWKKALKNKLNP